MRFRVWAVDSLEKVARTAAPGSEGAEVAVSACRNEYASGQFVVRAAQSLKSVQVSLSPLRNDAGGTGVEARARFVGYVPVASNTPDTPEDEFWCVAPCLVPDPLLLDDSVAVPAGENQPVWLTFFVPAEASPGVWAGVAEVTADGEKLEVPIRLTVHPVTLPAEQHLWVTNWMNLGNYARHYGTEMFTPRFWEVVEAYAANVAAHRQNVIEVPQNLVHIYQEADGTLSCDFTDWDRWVNIFDRVGAAKRIEGGSVARRGDGKWESTWFDWVEFKVTSRATGERVQLDAVAVIEKLLKAVAAHLKGRGLLDRYLLHVVDEPAPHTEEDYKRKSSLVHEWVPNVRYIEAMSCADMRGYLDVWVPNINFFDEVWPGYLKLREENDFELWFYTCMFPTGRYPNRFLDFTLLKARILHWINWRYRLPGYLHWGLNFWTEKPFEQDRIRENLPPGDCWIVYPGPEGPLDSLRWEQMREGLQDYELLWLLAQKNPELADAICAQLVPDPLTYARDWQQLRAAREEIIAAIGAE
jgi:hypothetical protein